MKAQNYLDPQSAYLGTAGNLTAHLLSAYVCEIPYPEHSRKEWKKAEPMVNKHGDLTLEMPFLEIWMVRSSSRPLITW